MSLKSDQLEILFSVYFKHMFGCLKETSHQTYIMNETILYIIIQIYPNSWIKADSSSSRCSSYPNCFYCTYVADPMPTEILQPQENCFAFIITIILITTIATSPRESGHLSTSNGGPVQSELYYTSFLCLHFPADSVHLDDHDHWTKMGSQN